MIKKQIDELSHRVGLMIKETEKNKQTYQENQTKYKEEKYILQDLLNQEQAKQKELSAIKNKYEISRTEIEEIEQKLQEYRKQQSQLQAGKNEISLEGNTLELKKDNLIETIQEHYMVNIENIAPQYAKEELDMPEKHAKWDEVHWDEVKTDLENLQHKLKKMGDVHLGSIQEYDEVNKRYLFLSKQRDDLVSAKEQLHQVIDKINRICNKRFKETFETVNERFQKVFPALFGGGDAFLTLTELKDKEDVGITVTARPPGKRLQNVSLLSGGEKALTAVSLIFAIFLVKPSPYCLLDEVDAPLDDANVFRFNDLIKEMSKHSQMILVTHNKHTMEISEKLYGVTMEEKGISKMVSVDMV